MGIDTPSKWQVTWSLEVLINLCLVFRTSGDEEIEVHGFRAISSAANGRPAHVEAASPRANLDSTVGSFEKSAFDRSCLPALDRQADAGGLVQSFLVLHLRIGIGDDAGSDLIDESVAISNERADGDVE